MTRLKKRDMVKKGSRFLGEFAIKCCKEEIKVIGEFAIAMFVLMIYE